MAGPELNGVLTAAGIKVNLFSDLPRVSWIHSVILSTGKLGEGGQERRERGVNSWAFLPQEQRWLELEVTEKQHLLWWYDLEREFLLVLRWLPQDSISNNPWDMKQLFLVQAEWCWIVQAPSCQSCKARVESWRNLCASAALCFAPWPAKFDLELLLVLSVRCHILGEGVSLTPIVNFMTVKFSGYCPQLFQMWDKSPNKAARKRTGQG